MSDIPVVDRAKVTARKDARDDAAGMIALIQEQAATYPDPDLRKHFLNHVYFLMADTLGLVPHGSELPPVASPPSVPAKPDRRHVSHDPEFVWAALAGYVTAETEKAVGIRTDGEMVWLPKSVLAETLEEGEQLEGVWVKEWFAEKESMEYED